MLTTDRLTIRPLEPSLIAELKEHYTVHQRFLNHIEKLSIDPTLKGWDAWIVQLKDGTYIGDIGFKGKPDAALEIEVGYGFQADYRGHGYATESVRALLDHVYRDYPNIVVKAECLKDNFASQRVLMKLGFEATREDDELIYWKKFNA
ncbi:GNAT family N-acetyltransferase [Macrococcus lamae]|uniref:N-acetyltransferase n=1 Tax=Macrococcus lamae TaxID=198484 RepID=A0A4R6BUX4_9STAP|nr:GNAT family N-acetyltransferase [Macrococcus lamae]TDM12116.1 N-acetyltransferase [Macrococcus lamae]